MGCSTNTDIFLFNLPRGEYLGTEQYKILESIKDGAAVDGKYTSQKLYFKKLNVLIVFANDKPKRAKLSMDRWVILKISNDLTELTDIVGENMSKNNGKSVGCGYDELSDEESDSQYNP